MELNPHLLKQLLLPAQPALMADPHMQAAVLLLVYATPAPLTILTLRSDDLPLHPGQISLPGGRLAPGDTSLEACALREAREEIGIDPASVELLGRLPRVKVSSGFEVTPVVGWTAVEPQLQADPREVAGIITCPMHSILQPEHYRREALVKDGSRREFWVLQLDEYRIWGATASILHSLASRFRTAAN